MSDGALTLFIGPEKMEINTHKFYLWTSCLLLLTSSLTWRRLRPQGIKVPGRVEALWPQGKTWVKTSSFWSLPSPLFYCSQMEAETPVIFPRVSPRHSSKIQWPGFLDYRKGLSSKAKSSPDSEIFRKKFIFSAFSIPFPITSPHLERESYCFWSLQEVHPIFRF